MIPLWLPWAVLLALTAIALPRPGSWLRTWGPAAIALVAALGLTVDHYRVSQAELAEATTDGASVVDGSWGGVTQDRLRVKVEDRLGRPVRLENGPGDTSGDDTGITVASVTTDSGACGD